VHGLRTGVGGDGLDCLGNAHRQNPALMEGVTQARVVEAQITCYRVNLPLRPYPDTVNGVLDLVEQGEPITRIARVALGHQRGKDKTGCWFRYDAGLSAKLRGTIALPFDNGGNGGIVGIDQFIVAQLLALGQPCGLFTDVFMVAHRRGEGKGETLTRGLTQGERLCEALLGLEGKGLDRLTECKELLFSVSHQFDEDMPLAAAASAKTTHDLRENLREVSGLVLERGGPGTALRDDVVDER
jgi:hypothetical protein